jgi:heat shock protein HslJ
MFCTTPDGIMVQESTYLNALAAARSYAIREDRLTLLDDNGDGILAYRAMD